jgi:hypothetical protein
VSKHPTTGNRDKYPRKWTPGKDTEQVAIDGNVARLFTYTADNGDVIAGLEIEQTNGDPITVFSSQAILRRRMKELQPEEGGQDPR